MSVQIYKGDILLSEPEVATTQWEKARGLMFRKQHDVLFHFQKEKKLKFHMVFVFYPIDIVFLDSDLKVVDLKPRFKPFTFYYSKACSSTVLETYAGFIRDRSIRIGDTLSIVHSGEIDRPSDPAPIPPAQRGAVFHGTSLGKSRDARVEQVSSANDAPQPTTTSKPAKPAKVSEPKATKSSSVKKSAGKSAKKPVKKSPKRTAKKPSKPTAKASSKRAAVSSKKKKSTTKSSKKPSTSKPKATKASKTKKSTAKPTRSSKTKKSSKK